MWCTAELVRSLCARREVLSSNLIHRKRGLPSISFIFFSWGWTFSPGYMPGTKDPNLQSQIASPGWETGSRASSQPGLDLISVVVIFPLSKATILYNKLSEYRGQKWKSPLKAQEIYILIYKENIHLMALQIKAQRLKFIETFSLLRAIQPK